MVKKKRGKNFEHVWLLFINFYFTSGGQGDGTPRKAIYKALVLSDPWLPQAKYATHALIENQMFWDCFVRSLHVLEEFDKYMFYLFGARLIGVWWDLGHRESRSWKVVNLTVYRPLLASGELFHGAHLPVHKAKPTYWKQTPGANLW